MKICSTCGERNEDWMDICQRCGNSIANADIDNSYNTTYNYGYDNNYDNGQSYETEKKKIANLDLLIVLGVLLVILFILIVYAFFM